MTLEEKAGLVVHPALEMGEGGTLLKEVRVFEPSPGVRMVAGPPTSDAILNKEVRHVLTRSHERPEILGEWNKRL